MAKLAAAEIAELDPYKFMATVGKRVIHPGRRSSTEALLERARITGSDRVLDVGCGVGTTAIEIGRVAVPYLGYILISGTRTG